ERLWVDVDALSAVGIGHETPIEVHQARAPARLAAETLQAANLVLGATQKGWIVSTAASLQSSESDWLVEGVVCRVPGTRTGGTNSAFPSSALPFKRWREEKSLSDFPWQPVWREGFDFAERQGGSTLYLDRSQTNLASVQLVDVRSLRGLQWTLFTVVSLAGCLWGPLDLRKGCIGLLCLAAAALILPATVAPLATASFCGAGVAFLFHRFSPLAIFSVVAPGQRPQTAQDDAVTKTMRLSASEISLLCLVGIIFFSQMASHAADPSDGSAVVVIPVDSESKKGGDTYYLSPALFEGVYEEGSSSPSMIDWLLTGAHYRIEFDWEENQKRLEVGQCTASMQVEVGLRETRVLIPIASKGVELKQCRVTVDGKKHDGVERTPEGIFLISIDEPGIYLVELSFPLPVVDTGGLRQVRFPIPALATSTLEVDLPVDAVPPEVLSAQGATRRDEVRNRLQVDLGNTDQLVLQWREGATAAEGDAADVDQLIWVKVQPGAVVVDARLKIDSRDRRTQRIQIATDPQLRLLSPLRGEVDGKSVPVNHVRTEPGDPQTIELQWDKAVDGELDIRLPFLWAGVSGMGTVRIPQFDVVGTRDYRRWIAVSVDPSLIVDRDAVSGDSLLKPLSIATAGETWNVAGQAPDFFYQQTGSQTDWSLPTRLEDSETVAFAKVALGISDKVTEVIAEYDLETTDGHRCQYHIDLPDHFQPERVEVFSEGVDRVLRWSTHEESGVNQLTLFLAEAVRGIQQLVIHGHMSHSAESLQVPRFKIKDVTMRGGQISIFRGPRVQVRLEGEKANWQRLDDPVPMAQISKAFGREVGVYELPVDTSAPQITIAANPVDAEAIQVVSLNRIDSQWIVDVDLRIEVKRGRLDTIRLRIPDDYAGPFRLDPPLPFTVTPLPGGAGSLLEVHPKDAITDALRLSIRGPLDIAPEDPVRCPIISTQDIPRVSRFVVMPKKVDLQDASWKTSGLVARRLPEDSENAPLAGTSVTSFQVTGRDYRAVLESVGQPAQEPEIPLATVDVATGRVDRYFGRIIFHLVPAGLSRVSLCLPHDSAKLLRIRVDDRSTTMRERDGCWEIELHSSNLLQRIEVLYSAPYDKRGRGMRGVSQPSLAMDDEKIPVDSTLWSLAGADRSGRWHAKDSPADTESAVARQYEYLHKRMRTSLDVLSDVTSAEPVEALLPWYNRAVRHLVSTEAEMDSLVAKIPASVPTAVTAQFAARSEVLAGQVQDLAGRLVTQGVFPTVDVFQDVGPLGPDPWQGIFPRPQAVDAEGPQGTLALEPAAGLSSKRSLRWWLAAMVLLAAGVIGFAPVWVNRWMYCSVPLLPLLFAIAMFYWLFLSPSILGFLVMTLIGVVALTCGWNRAVIEVPPRMHQVRE
ncbi:MAG: hypothetical protein P8K78_08300, partial [Pirellulales bacterium]|nr:hypothetical protein [Pirellulales bacterium]